MEKLTRKIMEISEEHNHIEAIKAIKESGKKALTWDKLDAYVKENGGIYYSGLFFAYAENGKKIGKTIEMNGYSFEVPKKFQGTDDKHMVIVSHEYLEANLEKKTVKVKLGKEKNVHLIPIHRESGWYNVSEGIIPNGEKSNILNKNARYWWVRNSQNLGLLVRGGGFVDDGRGVGAGFGPGNRCGVLVE